MSTQNKFPQNISGFGLIEIVVAIGIITAVFFAIAQTSKLAHRVVAKSVRETQAQFLLEEGVEVVKILRDAGWTAHIAPLANGVPYYPTFDIPTSSWNLFQNDFGKIQEIFTRTVTVENVYRKNSDDDIVDASSPNPKTLDPGTRKITVRVSWNEAATSTAREVITYISDLHQN